MERNVSSRVLVTSGPTRAYVDRIRYFSNTSTGALGSEIVKVLIDHNIPVVHIYCSGSATPKDYNRQLLESYEIETVEDLIDAVKKVAEDGDIDAVVHAMAVLDYIPESKLIGKKKSDEDSWNIRLIRTPKVIEIMRELMPDAYFVGFKLEAGITEEELIERAGVLLNKYFLDIVIANDLDRVDEKCHEALFIGGENQILDRSSTKKEIAEKIAELVAGRFS